MKSKLIGDFLDAPDIILFAEYELNFGKAPYNNPEFKQFVLNKKCPKCGAKIYWKAKNGYICQNCQEEDLYADCPNQKSKAKKKPIPI